MATGRRSFLASLLAWLTALLALVVPRRAPAQQPVLPSAGFTPPSGPADPAPLRLGVQLPDRLERPYDDFAQLMDDLFEHACRTGCAILSSDDPEMRRVGFWTSAACGEKEMWFHASITTLQKFGVQLRDGRLPARMMGTFEGTGLPEAKRAELMLTYIVSAKGRRAIAEALQSASRSRSVRSLGLVPQA